MRGHYSERRGRDRNRNRSRDDSRERKSSDHKHRRHQDRRHKNHRNRSRSRSTEKRRERSRSQERNRRENNRDQNKTQYQHDDKNDFQISPMPIDEEFQEDNANSDQNSHDVQDEEEDFTEEIQQSNGHHSQSNAMGEPEKEKHNAAQTQSTYAMELREIKNSYLKENLNENKKPKEENRVNKEVVPEVSTKEKTAAPAREIIKVTPATTETTANIKETQARSNEQSNGGPKKIIHKAKEIKPPKVISRELLKPIELRDEAAKQHVEELLASIKKQKREIPRLEKVQKGQRIEAVITESGERTLVKKKVEHTKIDLRAKINVAEDSSKSILNRIAKKPF